MFNNEKGTYKIQETIQQIPDTPALDHTNTSSLVHTRTPTA